MDELEQAAKLSEVDPEQLFYEICDSQKIGKQRKWALWSGYDTERFLPPFVVLSCVAIIADFKTRSKP